jgi:hypothetical protein
MRRKTTMWRKTMTSNGSVPAVADGWGLGFILVGTGILPVPCGG